MSLPKEPPDGARPTVDLRDLLALATHDLKNPLTAILANGHYVVESTPAGIVRDAAQGIVEAAEVATRMLSDLRDVAQAQDGGLGVRRTTMEVAALFHKVRRGTAIAVGDRSARLELPERCEPPAIVSDPDLLRRILENLVENALKYTRRGKVTVRYGPAPDGDAVELAVLDEGPSIEPGMLTRLFEPRVARQTPSTEGRGPSRGLGLYFCRLAAEALGGTIRAEANTPHGARFIVRVPAVVPGR